MPRKEVYGGVTITITKDHDEMSKIATAIILDKIKSRSLNLLVPTGTTPQGVYTLLKEQGKSIFPKATFFNMDEYCVQSEDTIKLINSTSPVSYRQYMKEWLFGESQVRSYFPGIENIDQEGTYDKIIKQHGGIGLCINAIGEDGHTFGFNFPGTSFASRTRLVKIQQQTKEVNQKLTGMETPEYAMTIGLKTGMESEEIILLVSGERKADILRKVIIEPINEKLPATILRNHKNCHWIVDEAAASKLGK